MSGVGAPMALHARVVSAYAPDEDSEKYRIAVAYERSGDFRNAARIFQELHAAQPSSAIYFDGVVRSLSALGQYAALVPLVEKQAKKTDSPSMTALAGTLNARLNRPDQARTLWEQARSLSGDDESIIVQIGRDQMELMMNADALESFVAARARNGSSTAYSDEIFRLRSASGDISGSVADVLAAFRVDEDAVAAERRLSVLLSYESGAQIIAENLDQLPQNEAKNLRLAAWFYRETKRWRESYEVMAKLDVMSSQPGMELLLFAEGARNSEQYDVALQAYDEVVKRTKDGNLLMSAVFGAVRCLELQMRLKKVPTPSEAADIVRRYDELISRFGTNPVVADALYFSALLMDDVLKDMDSSRDRLLRLRSSWRATSRAVDAGLRLADIFIVMGDDERARGVLAEIINGPKGQVGDRSDVARLKLADMLLWDGRLDTAKALYQPLVESTGSVASNDAIDRMLLLNLALDDSVTVRAIAKAEGLVARRRHSEAINVIQEAVSRMRDADMRDRAQLLCAKSYLTIGDSTNARAMLKKIIDSSSESIYGDRAMWMYADIVTAQRDPQQAVQVLESLLRIYPRSIIAPDARERIRRLRGDLK
ncbi:MAG: tetratricopeptide repeat protein [Candidatus Kapabacteria bacterium]|nr:tetratricopeptide repeat protein [Candidatus Kapabacteria bacterium]